MAKQFSLSETKAVGLLGVGLVGTGLASRLLGAGYQVSAWDPCDGARQRVETLGGTFLSSEAEVAHRCRRLVLSLRDTADLCTVTQRIAAELRPGDLIVDTTTSDPATVERVAGELEDREVFYADATLGGSSRQIRAGEALILCGASDGAFARAVDLLHSFGGPIFHTGPAGSGTRMKLVFNLVLGLNRAVLAEGLEFARRSGIEPERALQVLKAGPAYSRVMDSKGHKMIRGDFEPEARLAQHWKDVRLMLASAESSGVVLSLTELHEQLLREAVEAGWGQEDNSAIIKVFQEKKR